VKNAAILEQGTDAQLHNGRFVIRMDEGLIGLSTRKHFVLVENSDIAPFRMMESVESPKVGLAVIEPAALIRGYMDRIPEREWEALGVIDAPQRLALVIVSIGPRPQDSTANLLAPILVNQYTMTARQVILPGVSFSSKHPLF
jgi:flagellar assembly factor FliW